MIKIIRNLYELYSVFLSKTSFLLNLAARIWIGWIFFKLGLAKIANMEGAISNFSYISHIPLLPDTLSLYLVVFIELVFPVFLFIGFGTRIMVVPLILLTLLIHSVIPNNIHFSWLIAQIFLVFYGSGMASLDYMATRIGRKTTAK